MELGYNSYHWVRNYLWMWFVRMGSYPTQLFMWLVPFHFSTMLWCGPVALVRMLHHAVWIHQLPDSWNKLIFLFYKALGFKYFASATENYYTQIPVSCSVFYHPHKHRAHRYLLHLVQIYDCESEVMSHKPWFKSRPCLFWAVSMQTNLPCQLSVFLFL